MRSKITIKYGKEEYADAKIIVKITQIDNASADRVVKALYHALEKEA